MFPSILVQETWEDRECQDIYKIQVEGIISVLVQELLGAQSSLLLGTISLKNKILTSFSFSKCVVPIREQGHYQFRKETGKRWLLLDLFGYQQQQDQH